MKMKIPFKVLTLILLPLGEHAEAANVEERYEARLWNDCVEPSALYLSSGSNEDKVQLATCLHLKDDNISSDECIENVQVYLDEKTATMREALIYCLSVVTPEWNDPLHYRAQDYDHRPWLERILGGYPGKV